MLGAWLRPPLKIHAIDGMRRPGWTVTATIENVPFSPPRWLAVPSNIGTMPLSSNLHAGSVYLDIGSSEFIV